MPKRDNAVTVVYDAYGFDVRRIDNGTTMLKVTRLCGSRAGDKIAFSALNVGNSSACIEITGTAKTMRIRVLRGNVKFEKGGT